ncbi:MAG TPA: metallophosphoesterase [Actinomycetota bacterium]|nr:metallophosphoesterase [Actinomycetota bacterium]
MVAAGDIACPGEPCDQERGTAAMVERIGPDVVLALGDTQYRAGALADFRASYDRTWGSFRSITKPVPGNHEYRTTGAAGYFAYFGRIAAVDDGGDYSFQLGRWLLVAINSAAPGAITDGQLDRVRADLEESSHRCEIVYWHHPLFSSGAVEGSDPMPELASLWALLHAQRVDVVLNGHAHQYERFAPLGADGAIDDVNGIREFVVGTGGGDPHPFEEVPLPASRVRITEVHGVLELELQPRAYAWRFVGTDGSVLDHGSAACHG